VVEAGFGEPEINAVKVPGWLAKNFESRWADSRRREQLLDLIRSVEKEPGMVDIGPQMMAIASK
jgi:hypothetical protein